VIDAFGRRIGMLNGTMEEEAQLAAQVKALQMEGHRGEWQIQNLEFDQNLQSDIQLGHDASKPFVQFPEDDELQGGNQHGHVQITMSAELLGKLKHAQSSSK
jgi:hypothetical protein